MDTDDTPPELTIKLDELKEIRRQCMKRHLEERFGKRKNKSVFERKAISYKGKLADSLSDASFYDEMCSYDPVKLRKAIDDKIAKVEEQIREHRAGLKERKRA